MRTLGLCAFLAALLALMIALSWRPAALDAQLLELQLAERLPALAPELSRTPLELQALFIDYADDPMLVGKARLALLRYPQMTMPILALFGSEPLFQEVLKDYGELIIPPIHYFLRHDVATLAARKRAEEIADSVEQSWRLLRGEDDPARPRSQPNGTLTPEERAWCAINFIKDEGHDFLGQFVVDAEGQVSQVQTERILEALNAFFASGVRGLEIRLRRDEPVELGDAGWAALDLAVGISALKVLRIGRGTAAGARSMSFSQRSAALGSTLLRGSALGLRAAKYGAPLALAYIAVRHPSVLNSLFLHAAQALDVPLLPAQAFGWTLVLLPLVLICVALLRPLAFVLFGLARGLRWSEAVFRGRGGSARL